MRDINRNLLNAIVEAEINKKQLAMLKFRGNHQLIKESIILNSYRYENNRNEARSGKETN